jgi:2,3-bisphosphoglycerate-independent phosphoglycerate mutase
VKLSLPSIHLQLLNYRYYRNVLLVRAVDGSELSDLVSNTDPAHRKDGYFDLPNDSYELKIQECYPLSESASARLTAKLINEFIAKASDYLSQHPINRHRHASGRPEANSLITRNASMKIPKMPEFQGAIGMIVETPGERAVGELIKARFVEFSFLSEPSEIFYTNLADRVISQLATQSIDLLYVHTKGPDEPGHDGNPLKKAGAIELIDQAFFPKIIDYVNGTTTTLIVTSDHATPCDLKVHSADPVPVMILKKDWQPDSVERFTEFDCVCGGLGRIPGKNLLQIVNQDQRR